MNKEFKNITCDPSDLIPYKNNPRTHSSDQVAQLMRSIEAYGFTNPVLVDEGMMIVAGHGRVEAALKLSLKAIPCVQVSGWTDEEKRAYVIADNKLAMNSDWSIDLLTKELEFLKSVDFDMDLLGFDSEELDSFIPEIFEPQADEDAAPALPKKTFVTKGDVWILGDHRLLCGDSTVLSDVEKVMGGDLAHCVWTDPPYNVNYESKAGKIQNDHMENQAFHDFLYDAYISMYAVLKDGGAIYVAHADTEGLNFRSAFAKAGFKLSGCLIWKKNALVLGRSDYQWIHEPILYGWKPTGSHRFFGGRKNTTFVDLKLPNVEQNPDGSWQINAGGEIITVRGDNLSVDMDLSSVIYHDKPKKSADHPTMKPVTLIDRFIEHSTKKGDVVLDPFGGSGSTLISCHKLGRKARLIELDEKYCDVIINRWQEYTGLDAKHESGYTYDEKKL